jgi:hypothetical protein
MLTNTTTFAEIASEIRGIPLAKPNGDVRPIGIGGFFTNLAGRVAMAMDSPVRSLPTWQLGCAPNGPQRAVHLIREAMAWFLGRRCRIGCREGGCIRVLAQ